MKWEDINKIRISLDTIEGLADSLKGSNGQATNNIVMMINVAIRDARHTLQRVEYQEMVSSPPTQEEYEIASDIEGLTPQEVF